MANEEQLAILKQGAEAWNEWRKENPGVRINLSEADLSGAYLMAANLFQSDLNKADLRDANLSIANLSGAELWNADLGGADLSITNLSKASFGAVNLKKANLRGAHLWNAHIWNADLSNANLVAADLSAASIKESNLKGSEFSDAVTNSTIFGNLDLSVVMGLKKVSHHGPSRISTDTLTRSKGKIPEEFLRGCGLNDWEIESAKLSNPELSNEEINGVLYRLYDLRATQAIQISPLFISYSHADSAFVDKVGECLTKRGIRYWRDIHNMKAGRMEKQIDRAIRQNPTVLLVLSEHSLNSDWVEHEVRTARGLEKEIKRDVLCPVALDDCWKDSRWPKRVMEQITEYNILDFSNWEDKSQFGNTFDKLISGLELFYKE